ncbi:MAG: O-antigen ligase family protein [Planctomycetes bacterium]|nr:O-antigen ligase family protein [Planctomycetota bacterium]
MKDFVIKKTDILVFFILISPFLNVFKGLDPENGRYALLFSDLLFAAIFFKAVRKRALWNRCIALITLALILYGALNMFNPNVPDLITAMEGFRKSFYWLIAFFIGLSLASVDERRLLRAVFAVSLLIGLYGLKQWFHWSAFDQAFIESQSSGYGVFAFHGEIRPPGILSSPFHLGMLAIVGIAVAYRLFFTTLHRRSVTYWSAVIFFCCVVMVSQTRTNLIAVILVLFFLHGRRNIAVFAILIGLLMAIAAATGLFENTIGTLFHITEDNRFLNRWRSYEMFWEYYSASPINIISGFGTGSAGDTLGCKFLPLGQSWITSHSLILKSVFENGLIVSILYGALGIYLWYCRAWLLPSLRDFSGAIVLILLVHGLVGSAVEAWPVNIYAGLLVGFAYSRPRKKQILHTA